MFNFESLLQNNRTEILSGKAISSNKVELYNGNTIIVSTPVDSKDIGKSVKVLKNGLEYIIINFSNKKVGKNKVFIV